MGYADENKNWHETIGLEPFERNRTVNLGYGEYKNFYVERIYTRRFIMTEASEKVPIIMLFSPLR